MITWIYYQPLGIAFLGSCWGLLGCSCLWGGYEACLRRSGGVLLGLVIPRVWQGVCPVSALVSINGTGLSGAIFDSLLWRLP